LPARVFPNRLVAAPGFLPLSDTRSRSPGECGWLPECAAATIQTPQPNDLLFVLFAQDIAHVDAGLLRLRGLNGVPQIRRIEARNGAIEMNYIWGRDLRQILSAGRKINDEEIYRSFKALLAVIMRSQGRLGLY
jgi:hypothetical protein